MRVIRQTLAGSVRARKGPRIASLLQGTTTNEEAGRTLFRRCDERTFE